MTCRKRNLQRRKHVSLDHEWRDIFPLWVCRTCGKLRRWVATGRICNQRARADGSRSQGRIGASTCDSAQCRLHYHSSSRNLDASRSGVASQVWATWRPSRVSVPSGNWPGHCIGAEATAVNTSQQCPFSVGQLVIYRPSSRGLDADVMSPSSQRLIPGHSYRIVDIVQGAYIVPEGYSHPGGGIYWTEFAEK